MSLFYEKTPAEMSRYELQELEKLLRRTEEEQELADEEAAMHLIEGKVDEYGEPIPRVEIYKTTEEYLSLQREVK